MEITKEKLEKFKRIKKEAEEFYKNVDEVYCPYFKEKIKFNAKGLDHVKLKKFGKARSISEQYARLRLLHYAPIILRESNTLQEFSEMMNFERQKINSRWERRMVEVKYYGFVAIKDNLRIKVIVKEILGGERFFWSIIPFWKTRIKLDKQRKKKILYDGDLETQ